MSENLDTTLDEAVKLTKETATSVKGELLQDFVSRLAHLISLAQLLPPGLHDVVKTRELRYITESLQLGHLNSDDLIFWNQLGPFRDRMLQQDNVGATPANADLWRVLEVPSNMVVVYESAGFSPNDYLNCLGTDLMTARNIWPWIFSEIPAREIRSWVMSRVPSPEVAVLWMKELRETPEITMINYRTFGGDLARAKAWLSQPSLVKVQPLTYRVPPVVSAPAFTGQVAPSVRRSSFVASHVSFPSATREWLEEIVARARTVQPSIRKVPHWPAEFTDESQDLTIQLEQFPRIIKGVVKVGRERRWCEFNPSTFEISSRCENGEDRYVVGMSICWFIDCSITIHRQPRGASPLFATRTTGNSKGRIPHVRYIPTPTFNTRKLDARTSGSRLTIRHKVSGHLRKLPPGQRGSKQARSKAPEHVRRNMLHSETFVEPHFRGTEAEKSELFSRLSRYSALGDAMSDLNLN